MTDKKLEKDDSVCGVRFGSKGVPKDKLQEVMKSLVSGDRHKEGDPYKFSYVSLEEIRKNSQPGLIFNWGCDGIGFGQVVIAQHEGKLFIDDECMSKEFIKEMFSYFIDEYYKNNE